MSALDWLIVLAYAGFVVGVGAWAHRRQRSTEDYFLGGRRLRWWAVGVSLVATSFSSVSLIGGTAFGFGNGMSWWQLQLGDLIALTVVAFVFLPFFAKRPLTTAYEFLEERFGPVARSVAGALFLAQTGARAGILVFGPAAVLAPVLGLEVETTIALTAGAAILYSTFGGIAAVVWTDLAQMGLVVGSVVLCLILVTGDVPGGLGAIWEHAEAREATTLVDPDTDPAKLFTLLGACIPYAVFALSLYGTGQQSVQRFLSCEDTGSARRAAYTGWAVGTVALGITLFLGVALAAWVDLAPVAAGFAAEDSNAVLGEFMRLRLPVGAVGLLLAAVLAASMSSLDSAVHSMSTVLMVDFVRRYRRERLSPTAELRLARLFTLGIGILAAGTALIAAEDGRSLLQTLVRWLSYFAGPMLGLFLLAMFTRVGQRGAVSGTVVAFAATIAAAAWEVPKLLEFHPLWLCPAAALTTMGVGFIPLGSSDDRLGRGDSAPRRATRPEQNPPT